MKRMLLGILFPLALLFLVPNGTAQTPYLQVYFDENYVQTAGYCSDQPMGALDTLYVVAHNFDSWISAIEFKVRYPSQVTWIMDLVDPDRLRIGYSPAGIAISFPVPLSTHSPTLICRVLVVWMCDHCDSENAWSLICFEGYPSSGFLRAVTYPDLDVIYGTSGTAAICPLCCFPRSCDDLPPIPVEQRTWGEIKALYR
jgi:hypothetical protein